MPPQRPILRYHGGKWLLAPWIIQHLAPHHTYIEPFGGAASVLLRKARSYAEVYNDLDGDVVIENRDALVLMEHHDRPSTLHYVDPPYVFATRHASASSRQYYRHEMDDGQHRDLLDELLELEGMVVLSGYPSEIYDDQLKGWSLNSTNSRISAGRGTAVRQECLWLNPACMTALNQTGLNFG
ncbi:DNA adenine methylase [Pseudomonas aeruginosa]|uniref:DNA adenine methylase n=1 Tax=Pseudomonas aeruginosa TaxID=287 RepID=UPI0015DA9165|nr:DNA adenine methylase [Pseudomonas aeruginosa]ELL4433418.1 DNA adenine methylase [Pseudomonas aeruginosa]MCV0356237.1 DNA adenine methylase [Pseudomonas aeruginosa]MDJ1356489.1 DNA adenine methylase [Pseudomonas aeruginosa]HBO4836242.1 DNA adenine methylase [Pseudomonas aeruginosa]HCK5010697.1 DNA adenine methylase [Pseudomonas aeruginosa]